MFPFKSAGFNTNLLANMRLQEPQRSFVTSDWTVGQFICYKNTSKDS